MAAGPGPFLHDAAVFLAAAVIAVPLFRRFGLGSVLGYLAAGAAIGPHALGLIGDGGQVMAFAEFGIVLLLFLVGLELRPSRLWAMRRDVLGLGMGQIVATGLALWPLGLLFGLSWQGALVAGMGLALSSTAFALQLLQERGEANTPVGRKAFSILLAQDVAIVPLLGLVALLAGGVESDRPVWQSALIAVVVIVGLLLAGRYLLNPAFRLVAKGGTREVFSAAALLVVAGASLLMELAGLSMALGAFLAGMMLADSEYRHQLDADLQPFRGLLLGLFFIAVGMGLDLRLVAGTIDSLLLGVVLFVAVKVLVLVLLLRLFGSSGLEARRGALLLSQGGEFGFVLFTAAAGAGILTGTESADLAAAVTLSMILTPLLVGLRSRLEAKKTVSAEGLPTAADAERARVVVAGYGRMGQVVSRMLRGSGISVVCIDNDPERIRISKTFGTTIYFGDASRLDVLEAAGAGEAEVLVFCMDDREAVTHAVTAAREAFPRAVILCRAYDRAHVLELLEIGVDLMFRETFESGVQLGREALRRVGFVDETVDHITEQFRRFDQERLALQRVGGMYAGMGVIHEFFLPEERDEGPTRGAN